MGPKTVNAGRGLCNSGRKKKMISIDLKQEIIEKYERGVRVHELAKMYSRSTSTICTILKQKNVIKIAAPARGATIFSKLRTNIHEEMEKLLLLWIREKELAGDTVVESTICEKARVIYADLLKKEASTSKEASEEAFKASHGWFDNFKKRTGIHSVVRHGEAASADVKAAKTYVQKFAALVAREGYTPQQVFNCDETGLFWKKMPQRTYITAEEKIMPGHKPMKDRLTLALCANASGDCKAGLEEISTNEEEEEPQKVVSTSEIKDMLRMWEKLSNFIEKKHPEKVATGRALALFNDTCLSHFRWILKSRQKQSSLDTFLLKRATSESAESAAKKARTSEN